MSTRSFDEFFFSPRPFHEFFFLCFLFIVAASSSSLAVDVGVVRRIQPISTKDRNKQDQTGTVMFDIVAYQRSFRLPFQRNAKITASAAAPVVAAADSGAGGSAGLDHLAVSFR